MCLWAGVPALGDVRHVYFHSLFKVALLAYFHCFQPPTYSLESLLVLLLPFPPCTVGQSLLSRASVWILFLAPQTCSVLQRHVELASLNTLSCPLHTSSCVHLSAAHWTSLYVAGLVCSFSSPGPPSVPQEFCMLEGFL